MQRPLASRRTSGRPPITRLTTSAGANGASRRSFLELGFSSAMGLGLPLAAAGRLSQATASERSPSSGARPAKQVLFVFLFGGPSHIDTFDPKPDAPSEYRTAFDTIATSVPGLALCEHLPGLAQRAKHYAVIRTLTCNPRFGDHRFAVHGLLGGIDELPPGATLAASRRDWPCLGAAAEYALPRVAGLPNCAVLPEAIIDPGTGLYPGQDAGLLGTAYDPLRLRVEVHADDYRVDGALNLPAGMSIERLGRRRALLDSLGATQDALAKNVETRTFGSRQREAYSVLTSGALSRALDIEQEDPDSRERYGENRYGRTLLLARRLIESGVPLVQANVANHAFWDTHQNNFPVLQERLPLLDRALATLLDDMQASGLLDETLLVVMGEFGRTPKLVQPTPDLAHFTSPGRDHWTHCYSGLFAGAGIAGGQVIGRSDRIAAYPQTRAFSQADVGAAVLTALGIDPATELVDLQGRPLRLNHGAVIEPLYTAREA